jgi:hypothetical protein
MPWKKCTTAVGKSKLINAYKHKKVFKTTKKYPAPSDWIRTYEISSNEGRCQTVEKASYVFVTYGINTFL